MLTWMHYSIWKFASNSLVLLKMFVATLSFSKLLCQRWPFLFDSQSTNESVRSAGSWIRTTFGFGVQTAQRKRIFSPAPAACQNLQGFLHWTSIDWWNSYVFFLFDSDTSEWLLSFSETYLHWMDLRNYSFVPHLG